MQALKSTGTATRRSLRASLLAAVRTAPVLRTINWLTRNRPRILLYHRFAAESSWRTLGADVFEMHLRTIRDRFVPMTVSALCAAVRAGTVPANAVAITIDDGYEDVYRYAFPLLRAYGIPATFYVTTGFVEQALWLWPDRIAYLLERTPLEAARWREPDREVRLALDTPAGRREAWQLLADYGERLSWDQLQRLLDELPDRFGVPLPAAPPPRYAPVSWAQVAEMRMAGIEIGDHTWSHPKLTSFSIEQARSEIVRSRALMEARLGDAPASFAYPHGAYSPAIRAVVREVGYDSAVGGTEGPIGDWGDCFSVPRRSHGGGAVARFQTTLFGVRELASQFGIRS